jgi:hypothetical protein
MPEELRATIHAFEQAAKQVSDDVSVVTLEAINDDDLMNQMAREMQPDGEAVIDEALQGAENSQ